MSHEHDSYFDAIPGYVLGGLERAEAEAIERHLDEGCAECEAEMLRATGDLEALATTVEPVEPSEIVRARVLAAAAAEAAPEQIKTQPVVPTPAASTSGRWLPWAVAASLALLAWSTLSQRGLKREVQRLTAERAVITTELAGLEEDLSVARQRLQEYALASRIAASPNMQRVQLAGLDTAPEASAHALVESAQAKAVLYVSNLAPTDPDKTYQLWIIVGGTPVSAGVFDVDAGGGASVVVENLDRANEIEAWAVTVEPEGGVPQPTGPMVLMGAVA